MSNEQLVARIQAGEDVGKNMEQLYIQVKGFIHSIAWRYRDCGVEQEDLAQEGYLALYPAIDGYDPATGYQFLTYAEYHIKNRMQRYIQANGNGIRLSCQASERLAIYRKFCKAFQLRHGRRPSEGEIADGLGITLKQVRQLKKNACMANTKSLDAPVTDLDGKENTTLGELIAADENQEEEVLERVQQEQLCKVLWSCVDSLPGRQAEVVRHRYQEGKTLKQIGEAIGMTTEAVRQWESKALKELRKPSRAWLLLPFLPESEDIYSQAIRGGGSVSFNRTWTSSTERVALRL